MAPEIPEVFDHEAWLRAVEEARARLAPQFPEMDPQTMVTILASLLRPFGTGKRFFLRRQPDGSYVF